MPRHGPLPIRRIGFLCSAPPRGALGLRRPPRPSGAPRTASRPAGARNVAAAADASGHGVVAWARPDQHSEVGIEAVIRSARAWHPVRLLGLANTLMGRSPMVDDGAVGATPSWRGWAEPTTHSTWPCTHLAGRGRRASLVTPPTTLMIAADAAGDAAVAGHPAWKRSRSPSARATATGSAPTAL